MLFKEKPMSGWFTFNKWLREGNWWIGKIIEFKGDVISIDDCKFSVRSPAISTAFKSYFFFDEYEAFEREALKHFLDPRLPVVELGGAMGVIACLTNKRLHHPQKHVVVEANPEILHLLKENRERNDCRFIVLHKAIAYGVDEVTFNLSDDFWASSVQASFGKSVNVAATSLKAIVDEFDFEEFTLICDIEGGEADLVKFDGDILRDRVATLILEVHENIVGAELVRNMLLNLEEMGFVSSYNDGGIYVLQKRNN